MSVVFPNTPPMPEIIFPRQGEQCPVVELSYMGYSSPKCSCNGRTKQTHSSEFKIHTRMSTCPIPYHFPHNPCHPIQANSHGHFRSNMQTGTVFNSPKKHCVDNPLINLGSTSLEPKSMAISGLTTPKTTICMLFKYQAITHKYNTNIRHTRTIFF